VSVDDGYTDYFGNYRVASEQTKRAIVDAVGADREGRMLEPVYVFRADRPPDIPGVGREPFEPGYYEHDVNGERTTLIAVPPHAYVPQAVDARRVWGVAAQVYSLRSARNWGIGDFGDLARFTEVVRDAGGACVALNPLHALHLTNPRSASPYSPLSRLFLNAVYIDVPFASRALGGAIADEDADEHTLSALRAAELVDYEAVTLLKLRALRRLYNGVNRQSEPYARFRRFVERGGKRLRDVALYQALMEFFKAQNPHVYGWMQWPQEYQDVESAAVQSHAAQHARHVEFYAFLQWLADEQLAQAANACAMPIGLYRDLAVGVDPGSADVWIDRDAFMLGIAVGAPPDQMNEHGQNWGLAPLNPRVLRARAYAPFIDLLRANMRHAGALRIDHVMGLMRLFCIPAGMPSADGTYLHYPFEEMLGVLALESVRNRCMIIGEDLGTVPEGFRERMGRERVFSSRVLYFENDPQRFPGDAVASTGTHDLPPLRRYWEKDGTLSEDAHDDVVLPLVTDTYRRLGNSPARLVLAQIEDMLLQREQINTPGTFDEVPNWQRKIAVDVEELPGDRRFQAVAGALRETRPQGA
jgi:4-alpha-glucanotransferase